MIDSRNGQSWKVTKMRISAARNMAPQGGAAPRNAQIIDLFADRRRERLAALWDRIEPIALRVNTGRGLAAYHASLEDFSREQRLAHAVLSYVEEMANGGHRRFFGSAAGILWEDAMAGLRAIGATDNAMILSEAALRAGGAPSPDREERRRMLERLGARFHDLDARFAGTDPLAELERYMADNRAAFYFTKAAN